MIAFLLSLIVGCLGLACLWTYQLVTRHTLVLERLLGQERRTKQSGLAPWLLRWATEAAGPGERYTSPKQQAKIERLLYLAGQPYGLDLRLFLGLRFLALMALMGLGTPVAFLFGFQPLLILLVLGYYAPIWWLTGRANDRQAEIAAQVPDFLDTLAVSLRAGAGFYPTLKKVAQRFGGPLGAEFQTVIHQIEIGEPMVKALRAIRERTTSRELDLVLDQLAQAIELGVPVATTLVSQAASIRLLRVQRAKEKAAQASPKITMLTTFLVTPGVLVLQEKFMGMVDKIDGGE
jgi:tight adherence protein C